MGSRYPPKQASVELTRFGRSPLRRCCSRSPTGNRLIGGETVHVPNVSSPA